MILSISLAGQMVPAVVFAQETFDYDYGGTTYDYNYGGTTYDYNYGGNTYDYNYGGNTYDYNYGGNTYDYNYGGTTYDYNYGGNTYDYNYGDTGNTYDYNYGGTTYDYNYGGGTTYDYNYGGGTTYDYNYGNDDDYYTTSISSTPSYDYGYTPNYTVTSYPTYTYSNPVVTTPYISNPVTPTVTTPVVTTPNCPAGTVRVNNTCQSTQTLPIVSNTICSDGLAPVNNSCVRTNTIQTVTTAVCSDGLAPVNGSCIRTNTIQTITNTICSDGRAPVNGTCVRTNIIPAATVTYQSCWDGSTIPLGSVCPAQYKTCPNGASVPVTQNCPVVQKPVPPVTIKFNNVITSVATEITTTSARCNGIGLIASGASSRGWFEYGETPNLGRETAHANIGSSATAPFSNVLANLKPTATYYCRAVMENQYGTVKGEIVSFTTKATAVKYVKPVVTPVKTPVVKKPATKTEVICTDGTTTSVPYKSGSLLNAGQKLVSLQIEKVSGDLSAGSQVNYRLVVKNLSSESLQGTLVKITIPQEIVLTQASAGSFDPATRTLTIDNMPLSANGEGVVLWSGTVAGNAQAGKPIVTTAYTNYTVPGAGAQDEVSAYVVGSIGGNANGNGTSSNPGTGDKNVIGAGDTNRGFLPDTLVEWLALIAIIFIIFVLGRSVYTSMSEKKNTHH